MKQRNFFLTALVAFTGVVGLLLPGPGVHAVPANFQNEILITNLNEAVSLEFLPDGRMLVEGRLGTVWVSQPASGYTQIDSTPFLQLTNISNNSDENGLYNL